MAGATLVAAIPVVGDESVGVVDKHRYNCIKKLNSGKYATVYEAVDMETGERVALKKVKRTQNNYSALKREFDIQHRAQHVNIAGALTFRSSSNHIYLAQELVPGGDMFDTVVSTKNSARGFSQEQVMKWLHGVLSALDFLHSNGYVHGDIKLENIGLTNESDVKLLDFGFACKNGEGVGTAAGTKEYMAPEMLANGRANIDLTKVDVWAAGVLLYCLMSACRGKYEFPWVRADQSDETFQAFCQDQFSGSKARFSKRCLSDPAVLFLLENMLAVDPEKRCTAGEALFFLRQEILHFGESATPTDTSVGSDCTAPTPTTTPSPSGDDALCPDPRGAKRGRTESVSSSSSVSSLDEVAAAVESKKARLV